MRHQTSKFITILIVYVSFFLLPLGLNASINNNLLSSIHAESSNDYYTWSELELNKKFTESEESYILKKVIVRALIFVDRYGYFFSIMHSKAL